MKVTRTSTQRPIQTHHREMHSTVGIVLATNEAMGMILRVTAQNFPSWQAWVQLRVLNEPDASRWFRGILDGQWQHNYK